MNIDKTMTYTVKLTRLIKLCAFSYRPLNDIEMSGSVLASIIAQDGEEVVDYARPI
jgi:hypothetical protein